MAGRGLLFLLCFVWVVEWFDIPALVYDAPAAPFHLARAALLTAGIPGAAVIAIGHTYEQQRGLLRKLLETCVYCHRVKLPDGLWEHVDIYSSDTTRSVCSAEPAPIANRCSITSPPFKTGVFRQRCDRRDLTLFRGLRVECCYLLFHFARTALRTSHPGFLVL